MRREQERRGVREQGGQGSREERKECKKQMTSTSSPLPHHKITYNVVLFLQSTLTKPAW